jgi:hypothetical protein
MYTSKLFFASLFALMATATPIDNTLVERGSESTFNINVWNNCPFTKQFALYQIDGSFNMIERSKPVNIASRKMQTIVAPYKDLGMRLSGHAEWGTAGQWAPQALFEFGYSEYNGVSGSAYDISIMLPGSDKDIGVGVYPIPNGNGSKQCPSKTCFPWDCPLDQGWTNPDQTKNGSPADTVCYHGKTDFKVVFCP